MQIVSFDGVNEKLFSVDYYSGSVDIDCENHTPPELKNLPCMAANNNKTVLLELTEDEILKLTSSRHIILTFIPNYISVSERHNEETTEKNAALIPFISIL